MNYCSNKMDRINSILSKVSSKETRVRGEAVGEINKLWQEYIDEEGGRKKLKQNSVIEFLDILLTELKQRFMESDKWYEKQGILLCLSRFAISDVADGRPDDFLEIIFRGLDDEDGRVRRQSVYLLDWFRVSLQEHDPERYLQVYLDLQEWEERYIEKKAIKEDNEGPYETPSQKTKDKKLKSIRQALECLYYPDLERLLEIFDNDYIPEEFINSDMGEDGFFIAG